MGESLIEDERREYSNDKLQELLEHVSPRLGHILGYLPGELPSWVGAGYLITRVINEIDDNEKFGLVRQCLMSAATTIGNNARIVKRLEEDLSRAEPTRPEYKKLFDNLTLLHESLQGFPDDVRSTIRSYNAIMSSQLSGLGLKKEDEESEHRYIEDKEAYLMYCRSSSGIMGFMVIRLLKIAGYLSLQQFKNIRPNTYPREGEPNPIHDFCVGLQMVDNIRNLHRDVANGIYRWPSRLLKNNGLSYNDLINLGPQDGDKLDRAYKVLEGQIKDARRYISSGANCLEEFSVEHEGLRKCGGNILGIAAATLRVVDNRSFFYDERVRNVDSEEVSKIEEIIGTLAQKKRPMNSFIGELCFRPAGSYVLSV